MKKHTFADYTPAQLSEFEAEIKAAPPGPGEFICPGCRWSFPEDDRHVVFLTCYSCGTEEIERLLVEARGTDTTANRRRLVTALAHLITHKHRKAV